MKKQSFREVNALLEFTQQGKVRTKTHTRQIGFPEPVILSITFSFPDMLLVSAANSSSLLWSGSDKMCPWLLAHLPEKS